MSVMDLQRLSGFVLVSDAFRLLSGRSRKRYVSLIVFRCTVGLVDLLALGLVGIIGQLALSNSEGAILGGLSGSVSRFLAFGTESIVKQFVSLTVVALVLFVAKAALSIFVTRRLFDCLASEETRVSTEVFEDLLASDLESVQQVETHKVAFAISYGVANGVSRSLGYYAAAVAEGFTLVTIGAVFLIVEPTLTIVMILYFSVIGFGLQKFVSGPTQALGETMSRTTIASSQSVQEGIRTFRVGWVLGLQGFFVGRFARNKEEAARSTARVLTLVQAPRHVIDTALIIGLALVGAIEYSVSDFQEATKSVAFVLIAGTRVSPSLLSFQGALAALRIAASEGEAFHEVEREASRPRSAESAPFSLRMHSSTDGLEVDVSNLTFAYRNSDGPVLRGVSFRVHPGSMTAIMGPSGSGKSTLADLIIGVLPSNGGVRIAGRDPSELVKANPGIVGYVPQETVLTDASIAENVAFGLSPAEVNRERVAECLEMVGLDAFIAELSAGMDTDVGEFGSRLSGGQRQRIGIARALYTRPQLLVMDEVTSALDPVSEDAIVRLIEQLRIRVTVITIAHKASTVANADKVITLKAGVIDSIVPRGKSEE